MLKPIYEVATVWLPIDIKAAATECGMNLTDDDAENILMELEEALLDRMIEAGWDVITTYLYNRTNSQGAQNVHNA